MSPMRTTALSTEVAVDVRAVTKVFGAQTDQSVTALDQVSVSINQNEFFTLLGPSGCGKTTLLRLVAGFDHPTEGAILLDGDDISPLPPHQRPVNTVFQNYTHFPHRRVMPGNAGNDFSSSLYRRYFGLTIQESHYG